MKSFIIHTLDEIKDRFGILYIKNTERFTDNCFPELALGSFLLYYIGILLYCCCFLEGELE
jgi:hypothetical protein